MQTRNVQVKLAVDGRQQRQQQTQEQTSASGLQSYSAGGMGNQGFGAGFGSPGMGNRPMLNQPMAGGNLSAAQLSQLSNLSGYANQGGVTGGQYGNQQMGTGQGFGNPAQQFVNPVGQQFGQQGQAAPLQQPSQQQFANQPGFGTNSAGAVQQFTPQAGGQQQFGQQGFTNPGQQQFPAQMVGQVGGVQQPQAQFAAQGGTLGMTGYQQAAAAGAPAGVASGLPNTIYSFNQGQ
jgi:morphogenetic protein associated with SpoVID